MTFLKSLFMWKNSLYNFLKANNNILNIIQDFTIANKKHSLFIFEDAYFFHLSGVTIPWIMVVSHSYTLHFW